MNQLLLAVFFSLALGAAFVSGAGFGASADALGRPRVPASFIALNSDSQYTPAEPIYLWGLKPCLLSLLFSATLETLPPKRSDIMAIVNSSFSIYKNIGRNQHTNQVKNAKEFPHFDISWKYVKQTGYYDKT